MNKLWILVVGVMLLSLGCGESTEKKKTKDTKSADGPAEVSSASDTESDKVAKTDTERSAEAATDEKEDNDSAAPVAQTVLDDALAAAKANNKALFIHFTADW